MGQAPVPAPTEKTYPCKVLRAPNMRVTIPGLICHHFVTTLEPEPVTSTRGIYADDGSQGETHLGF